jgi:O-succinylbenzoic acid--CoA ligase
LKPSQQLHPSFKFNGLQFETSEEIVLFAQKLKETGAPYEFAIARFIVKWFNDKPYIKVKTSGSTGAPKKIKLLKINMVHSAFATGVYFNLGAENTALLCLSAKYIAGKMMLVRALTMGWDLHIVAPDKDAITQYDNAYDFAAMVPYQVYHTLSALDKIKILIIGGGVISPDLEAKLQSKSTEVYATYGMTETITHVAMRRVNGHNRTTIYSALPNISFSTDARGCLVIDAPNLTSPEVVTNDVVTLFSPTSFEWLGRYDNVINSGGVKLFPEKIEQLLRDFIKVPFIISSLQDQALGEQLILVLELENPKEASNYRTVISELEPYQRPKKIFTLSKFPLTETGKIKRSSIRNIVKGYK